MKSPSIYGFNRLRYYCFHPAIIAFVDVSIIALQFSLESYFITVFNRNKSNVIAIIVFAIHCVSVNFD